MCIAYCGRKFLMYLFLRIAGVSYGRFITTRCRLCVNAYSGPLVIGKRGEI